MTFTFTEKRSAARETWQGVSDMWLSLSSPHSLHLPMAPPFSQSCELQTRHMFCKSISPIQTSNLLPRLVYSIFLPTHSQKFAEPLCGLGQGQGPGDSAEGGPANPCCSSLRSHSATVISLHLDLPAKPSRGLASRWGVSWLGSFLLLSELPEYSSQNTGPKMAGHCLLLSLKASWARLCLPGFMLFSLAHGVTSACCCSLSSHSFQALYTSQSTPTPQPDALISFSLRLDHSSLPFTWPTQCTL